MAPVSHHGNTRPFALLTLGVLPFMSLGKALEIQTFMPQDEKEDEDPKANSSAGIVVESLSNIRTVAALTIEEERLEQFDEALVKEDPHPFRTNAIKGSTGGLSQIVQMWGFGELRRVFEMRSALERSSKLTPLLFELFQRIALLVWRLAAI